MAIDLVLNRHKKIQNMSVEDMAKYFGETLDLCCDDEVLICPKCKSCRQCWKEFLQGSDE